MLHATAITLRILKKNKKSSESITGEFSLTFAGRIVLLVFLQKDKWFGGFSKRLSFKYIKLKNYLKNARPA